MAQAIFGVAWAVFLGSGPVVLDGLPPKLLTPEQLRQEADKAGKDPAKLIQLAQQAPEEEMRRLLHRAMQLLTAGQGDLSPQERERLARLFASSLERAARSPDDVAHIMGPKARPTVVRQVIFRMVREQWLYETPFRLAVTIDYRRGHDPRVSAVRILPPECP
jgi:hypothetical protein